MPNVKWSPIGNGTNWIPGSALVANGYKLFFYDAGTTTKHNTYTTNAGSVANANPVVLDAYGFPSSGGNRVQIWLEEGVSYKVVIASGSDTDPPSSGITLGDYVSGVNDVGDLTYDQWVVSGLSPTYVSATSFTLSGDQTATFSVGRRVKTTNTGGTIYSKITASSYSAPNTTVTIENDSGTLDSGLSAVSYGLLTKTNSAIPSVVNRTTSDNSDNIANTAFVTPKIGGFNNMVSVTTTPYTITAANVGCVHECTSSASALTMPAIAGLSVGNSYTVTNYTASALTVSRDGSSTFTGVLGSTTAVKVEPYASVVFTKTTDSVWSVMNLGAAFGRRLLSAGAVTSTANLQFILSALDPVQDERNRYLCVLTGVQPATNDSELWMQLSVNGGSSYVAGASYYSGVYGIQSSGLTSVSQAYSGGAKIIIGGGSAGTDSWSNVADETGYVEITITNCNTGGSLKPMVRVQNFFHRAASNVIVWQNGAGMHATSDDYDAFQLYWESGNWAAVGYYALYKMEMPF